MRHDLFMWDDEDSRRPGPQRRPPDCPEVLQATAGPRSHTVVAGKLLSAVRLQLDAVRWRHALPDLGLSGMSNSWPVSATTHSLLSGGRDMQNSVAGPERL